MKGDYAWNLVFWRSCTYLLKYSFSGFGLCMRANVVCLQASGRNAASSSRLKQTAELMWAGALCCWTAMCTLRPCWGKVKIHLKCSRGLGCVTAALGSVSDPDEILSLDPPEDGAWPFHAHFAAQVPKKGAWAHVLAESVSPGQVLDQGGGGLELQSWHNLSYSQLWISPVLPTEPLLWKGLSNGKHMEVFVETGNPTKTPLVYRCVQTSISCPKGRNWI